MAILILEKTNQHVRTMHPHLYCLTAGRRRRCRRRKGSLHAVGPCVAACPSRNWFCRTSVTFLIIASSLSFPGKVIRTLSSAHSGFSPPSVVRLVHSGIHTAYRRSGGLQRNNNVLTTLRECNEIESKTMSVCALPRPTYAIILLNIVALTFKSAALRASRRPACLSLCVCMFAA